MTDRAPGRPPDEPPVPIRRAAIGCLVLALVGLGLAGLVRPLIFSVAPPRDDTRVVLSTLTALNDGPVRRDQLLSRTHDLLGEIDAGDGRVQVTLIVSSTPQSGVAVVNAASPVEDDCDVEIGADRLADCAGRAWTYAGVPIDPSLPPLQRFPVVVENGAVIADLTRPISGPS